MVVESCSLALVLQALLGTVGGLAFVHLSCLPTPELSAAGKVGSWALGGLAAAGKVGSWALMRPSGALFCSAGKGLGIMGGVCVGP